MSVSASVCVCMCVSVSVSVCVCVCVSVGVTHVGEVDGGAVGVLHAQSSHGEGATPRVTVGILRQNTAGTRQRSTLLYHPPSLPQLPPPVSDVHHG